MADDQTLSASLLGPFKGEPPPAPAWFDAAIAVEPERSIIEVEGTPIELLTWGEVGKPGLLLLHGNVAHADWWSFIAPFFAKDWRVAAISWAGMGASGWREAYSARTFAAEAFAAVEAAQLEAGGHKPIFVGHSFGGFPTLYCAARHAERLRGAILVDSSIQPPEKRWKGPPPRSGKGMPIYPTLPEALARFRLAPPQPCENLYVADFIARRSLKRAPLPDGSGEGWTWKFDPFLWSKLDRSQMQQVQRGPPAVPIAQISGDRSAIMRRRELGAQGDFVPSGVPHAIIPDSEHHIMVDQPLALVAALRTLLAVWPA